MYRLLLVNHSQMEYAIMCRSNLSQERTIFRMPSGWDGDDDMEIMTEFVFREKLKNRRKYTETDICPLVESEDEDEEVEDENEKTGETDDLQEDYRKAKIENKKKEPEIKKKNKKENDREEEREEEHQSLDITVEPEDPDLADELKNDTN